jgi:hypothetical protein
LALTHIVLRKYEASASTFRARLKRLLTGTTQDVPMQTKPVLLIFKLNYTGIVTIKSIFIVAKTFNWCYSMLS